MSVVKSENEKTTIYTVDEHHQIYKKFLKYKGRFFNRVTTVSKQSQTSDFISEDEFFKLDTTWKKNNFNRIKDVMRFEDETKVKETNLRVNGKFSKPSSVAAVTFSINENADYLELNVSIPKYLYQHSLAEFIPQPLSNTYLSNFNLYKISEQRKIIYKRLLKFIDKFFSDICKMFELDCMPNYDYVELRRIDLCFNQYHQNKSDALLYLNNQKKIIKKKYTKANIKSEIFDTSITYFTQNGAYFKIYHKGSEYISSKSGDLKKHSDFNANFIDKYLRSRKDIQKYIDDNNFSKEYLINLFDDKVKDKPLNYSESKKHEINKTARHFSKILPFKTLFLKEQMDKVLRYEISLRGDFFKYHYKRKIYRKNDDDFKQLQSIYNKVHSIYNSNQKDDNVVTKYERLVYRKLNSFYNKSISLLLSSNKHLIDKIYSKEHAHIKNMTQNTSLEITIYKYTLLSTRTVGLFTDDFLQICFNNFFKIVKQFQLKELDTFDSIASKINDYNEKVEERKRIYDKQHKFLTLDALGNPLIKGNRIIVNASELLTSRQKQKLGLKRVNALRLLQILQQLQQGKSLHQIRSETNMHKSTYQRLKTDLEMFGIYETTLQTKVHTNIDLSFKEYYFNTNGYDYQNNFYFKPQHKYYA